MRFKKGQSGFAGRCHTKEQIIKIKRAMKTSWKNGLFDGRKHYPSRSKETFQKISEGTKRAWLTRERHLLEEYKQKISDGLRRFRENHPDFQKGKNHPCWRGGISREPYAFEFDEMLRKTIRERDNYICQECGRTEEEELKEIGKILSVHHIDYDKKNCKPSNLITLCDSCNSKANFSREDWIEYFREKIGRKMMPCIND